MTIGEKITKLRTRIGIKQKDLAASLGVDPARVSEWVNDKAEPSLILAARMAKIFGVSLDYFADDEMDDMPTATRTEQERRILEIADMLGYDLALSRLINAPEPQPAAHPGVQSPAGPRVGSGTVVRPPVASQPREKGVG